MRGMFAATWMWLRRPGLRLSVAGLTAMATVLITVVTFASARHTAGSAPGAPDQVWTTASLSEAHGIVAGLTASCGVLGAIAFCVAGVLFAGRFSGGTIRNIVLRRPERVTVLAGSVAAVVVFAVILLVVAAVAATLTGVIAAGGAGVRTATWFTGSGALEAVRALARVGLSTIGYSILGAALGVLIRGPVVTVAVGLSWLLIVELVVGDSVAGDRWLPGRLLAAVAGGGSAAVPFGRALTTTVAYTLFGSVLAAVVFVKRDITE
jgi:ABC-2 type transport system permease protein